MADVTRKREWLKYVLDGVEADDLNNAVWVMEGDDMQSRIDSAPVDGTVVFDPSVTFTTTSPLSVSTAGLTLATPHIDVGTEISKVLSISADGVTVEGGHINGAKLARVGIISTGNDTTIRDVTLERFSESTSGSAPSAIRLKDGENATVTNCTVRDVSAPHTTIARGIVTSGSTAGGVLKITNNTVEDISPVDDADGIVVGGAWTRAVVTGNIVENGYKRAFKIQPAAPGLCIVSNNHCYSTLTDPVPFCAISVQQENAIVANNVIDYETANVSLIQLQGDNAAATGNDLIVRNPDTGCDGINAPADYVGMRITDNTILGVQRDGVRFGDGTANSTISGNIIRSPGRHGINIGDGTINPDSVTISQNTIDSAGDRGIIVYSATNTTVSGNAGTATGDFIDLFSADVEVGHNSGYITHDSGSATASGDGATTTFTIPHGLEKKPSTLTVTPTSQDAAGTFWVSNRTYTDFDITYASAPPSGTDNLSWEWVGKEQL